MVILLLAKVDQVSAAAPPLLNAVASRNIPKKLVTLLTFQELMSWLKGAAGEHTRHCYNVACIPSR